jgi:hypothetical protein
LHFVTYSPYWQFTFIVFANLLFSLHFSYLKYRSHPFLPMAQFAASINSLVQSIPKTGVRVHFQATSGNPIAQANPHATHKSISSGSEAAAPELVDAAAPADEDEAGEDEDACEVIDAEADECASDLEVDFASLVLDVAPPVAVPVVFASPVLVASVVADMPVVLIGPPGLSEVIFGSGLPVNRAVSRTHVPAWHE